MSTKLKVPKATTTNLRTQISKTTTMATKSQRCRSDATASFGASTSRSVSSTASSSASSCNSSSRRSSNNKNATSKRFITHTSNTNLASPFGTFITRGPRTRQSMTQANDFAYDLSKDEHKFVGAFKGPMKAVPDRERELLQSGKRNAYLAVRYEYAPDRKYNYPEATSWRIGWFHNQM